MAAMIDSPGAKFERLLAIMQTLREPGGCPWDREQTHASLRPFVLEETYEVLEAIESDRAYVNVHTNDGVAPPNTGPGDFPGGEIRGFLVSNAIPEPASIAVLGVLATGLGVAACRRTARA